MKGSGKSLQQNKEELFDEYERFRSIGNESIHDYFVRFHKLINDIKITQLDIPAHQMNTKFVNNLPPYWAKYVTNTSSILDPLAYLASTTHHLTPTQPTNPPPSTSSLTLPPQPAAQSSNDAMLETMNQIVNLLSGFQKQFPPTNNQLRTSSNSRSHAMVYDGQIVTETVQRKAPCNVGHVSRQCKEKKRVKDSQYFKDKMLLMEAKKKGAVLDAEAEAFLADVECTAPYDQPLVITTINIFKVSHEDAYNSDVDDGPHAATAFMANLSSTSGTNGATTSHVNEAKISQPTLYDGHALLKPTNTPVRVYHSKESLIQAESLCSSEGTVPRTAPSKVRTQLLKLKDCFPAFETIIKRRTTPTFHEQGKWHFVHIKKAFTEQVIPFYEHVKELVQSLDENLVKEATEFMRIFAELDKEYEQCVFKKQKLQIKKKNLLIQNECLITDCIAKDICSIVLASDRDRPLSEEISSNCVRDNSKVIELEAKILKQQQMLAESDKRCSFIQRNHIDLQIKFRNYKECLKNQTISDNSHSPAVNTVFEINQLKEQLQGKDDTIRKLQTQINSMSMLNVEPTVGVKPATEASKPMSKSDTRNHSTLPAKRKIARRVEDHHRNLNKQNHVDSHLNVKRTGFVLNSNIVCNACNESLVFANHDNCVVRNLKSVNVKTPTAKHNVKTTKKVWKAKVVTVRFTDYKLSNRKAGSKRISGRAS
nr:hypothetical protein [Tanacetum cinerariifolium]